MKTIKKMSITILLMFSSLLLLGCSENIQLNYGLNSYNFSTDNINNVEEMIIYTTNLVMKSTVEITSEFEFSYTQIRYPFGTSTTVTETSKGYATGFIINSEGYILTNAHVVIPYDYIDYPDFNLISSNITINFALSDKEFTVEIIDYQVTLDLALVKIKDLSINQELKSLTIFDLTDPSSPIYNTDDSIQLMYGETVLAIGNAYGLGISVTKGLVSAPVRYFSEEDGTITEAIQTDAAINPGNSGGPLVNLYGAVLGIVSFKFVDDYTEGLGYAIPSNVIISYINGLDLNIALTLTSVRNYTTY